MARRWSGEAVALGAGRVDVVVLVGAAVGEQLGVALAVVEGGQAELGYFGCFERLLHLAGRRGRPATVPAG